MSDVTWAVAIAVVGVTLVFTARFAEVIALLLVNAGLTYLLQAEHNLNSFVDGEAYKPTPKYYVEQLLNNIWLTILFSFITNLYYRSLELRRELTYSLRRSLAMCGFLVAAFCVSLAVINILLTMLLNTDSYRFQLNWLYHLGKPLSFSLALPSLLLPQPVLIWLTQPLSKYLRFRKRRQQELLVYLHGLYAQIVPGVQLHCDQLYAQRVLIEISDARQIIWSQKAFSQLISPQVEVAYLKQLLLAKTVLQDAGPFLPPPTKQLDVIKHNLRVARGLKRLEN